MLLLLLSHELFLDVKILLPRVRPRKRRTFLVGLIADGDNLGSGLDLCPGFIDFNLDLGLLLNFMINLVLVSPVFIVKMVPYVVG